MVYSPIARPIRTGANRSPPMSRITIPTLDVRAQRLEAASRWRSTRSSASSRICFASLALSPAALEGLLGLSGALSKTLDVKTRERIAIAVAEMNGCDYCLSAHTYLGLNLAKITPGEMRADAQRVVHRRQSRRRGPLRGPRSRRTRGGVSDADIAAVKQRRLQRCSDRRDRRARGRERASPTSSTRLLKTDIDFPVLHTAEAA